MEPASALLDLRLQRASDLEQGHRGAAPWSLDALRGRLTELVGGADSANISVASRLIHQAQTAGDLGAWVATHRDVFFPPDLAAAGIDLSALPVVWAFAHDEEKQRGRRAGRVPHARAAARAAERLLRSGAFGLIVLDLARDLTLDAASQGRLLRLAEHHDAQVLILRRRREDERYSGSLVGVRAQSTCRRIAPGRFRVTITNTKDKREGPGWTTSEEFDGPPGLY